MSDFNAPEYIPYITLCRKLAIKHELEHGDWYTEPRRRAGDGQYIAGEWEVEQTCRMSDQVIGEPGKRAVWLPSLTDWLEILPVQGFALWKRDTGWACRPINAHAIDYDTDHEDAYTPEEACARLWMAGKENWLERYYKEKA